MLNAAPVILRWCGAAAPADPNVEGEEAPVQDQEATVTGLVHYVGARSVPNGFMVFEKLDALVTFESDVDLRTRDGITFELPDGKVYVQADTGGKAVDFWDLLVRGERLAQTVALRKL